MKTIVCLLLLFLPFITNAQPGTLDKSFGDGGVIVGKYDGGYPHVAFQQDGKFIAAGTASLEMNTDFLLIRYNEDGSVDTSFGNKGSVSTVFPAGNAYCSAARVQADSKIVAGGTVNVMGNNHIALARYNSNGTLDKAFGKEGLVDFSIAVGISAYVTDMVIQPDGKIVVTGNSDKGRNNSLLPFIVRFDTNGAVDKTFGNEGEVFTPFDNDTKISSLLLQPDGKILLGGTYQYLSFPKFMVLRYLPTGVLDNSFGTEGVAKQAFDAGAFAQLNSIVLQQDGSIVGGGFEYLPGNPYKMALVRFTPNGSTDTAFGKGGTVITALKDDADLAKVLLQQDGRIVGAGTSNPGEEGSTFAVIRYLPDGTVDSSFGSNGVTLTAIQDVTANSDAALQKDGKILLAGISSVLSTENEYFAFARYNNDVKTKQPLAIRIKRWLQHHGISWQLTQNSNVRYYAVQRSSDGIVYKEIAKLPNSSNTYEDAAPLGKESYYRVTAIAKDGSRTYSNTILIDESQQVRMFPNPAKDNLQLQGLATGGKTAISIVDLQGNVRATATAGGGSYSVNTANLTPGNYLLKLQHNGTVTTQAFVKE